MTEVISVVNAMHGMPRFGHSSSIASLASVNSEDQDDYIQGIKSFAFFLVMLMLTWICILIGLKFAKNVGCAGGGGILDIQEIRKTPRELRPSTKTIVYRAWRLQTVFILCGLLLPVASVLSIKYGLWGIENALQEVGKVVIDVESLTYEGVQVVDSLISVRDNLEKADLIKILDVNTYCPEMSNTSVLLDLNIEATIGDIKVFLDEIDIFIDEHATSAKQGFKTVLDATENYDIVVERVFDYDWILKLCITVLIIIDVYFLAGVFLSRHNIAFLPLHAMLSWLLVPLFWVMLILAVFATCGSAVVAVMNSDFCSGGSIGTMEEIFQYRGVDGEDLLYQSFMYYASDCETMNPLEMFAPEQQEFLNAIDTVSGFLSLAESFDPILLEDECGKDMTPVFAGVQVIGENLSVIASNVRRVEALTSCFKVRPILHEMFHGPACTGSIKSLTWLFSCMLVIAILSLIMLSVRASLYNAIIRRPRASALEEWEEYKEYMAQYYDDTDDWRWRPAPLNTERKHDDNELKESDSFGTSITAKLTFEESIKSDPLTCVSQSSDDLSIFMDEDVTSQTGRYTGSAWNFRRKFPWQNSVYGREESPSETSRNKHNHRPAQKKNTSSRKEGKLSKTSKHDRYHALTEEPKQTRGRKCYEEVFLSNIPSGDEEITDARKENMRSETSSHTTRGRKPAHYRVDGEEMKNPLRERGNRNPRKEEMYTKTEKERDESISCHYRIGEEKKLTRHRGGSVSRNEDEAEFPKKDPLPRKSQSEKYRVSVQDFPTKNPEQRSGHHTQNEKETMPSKTPLRRGGGGGRKEEDFPLTIHRVASLDRNKGEEFPTRTPVRNKEHQAEEEIRFSEKTREIINVLDEELVPFCSPTAVSMHASTPRAPRKKIGRFRRTNQNKFT